MDGQQGDSRRSLTGGLIWVIPTTLAMAPIAAMILTGERTISESLSSQEHRHNAPSERIGVLLSKLLKEHDAELREQAVLLALLDDDRKLARQVRSLLPNLGALVVETPEDGRDDLGEVGLDADAERVDDGSEAFEHDLVLDRLLLEGIDDAVDELDLQTLVDICIERRNVSRGLRTDDEEDAPAAPKPATTLVIISMTILRYGSLSSLRSLTSLPTISLTPAFCASSTVVSTTWR